MPSVFTLEAPFGDPVPAQDYLELLGDPLAGYDTSLGHSGLALGDAMFGGISEFYTSKGLLLGSLMALGTSLVVGMVVGNAALYGLNKLGVKPRE